MVFAHGSGSSRFSRRNRAVAAALEHAGFGTLLLDLLTPEEEAEDERTAEHRFNIPLLGRRVVGAVEWLAGATELRRLPIGYFGASTGAAAALIAAAARPDVVGAVDLRGAAGPISPGTRCRACRSPTLLIVGGDDTAVHRDEQRARCARMHAPVELEVVPRRHPPVRGAGRPRAGGRIGRGGGAATTSDGALVVVSAVHGTRRFSSSIQFFTTMTVGGSSGFRPPLA